MFGKTVEELLDPEALQRASEIYGGQVAVAERRQIERGIARWLPPQDPGIRVDSHIVEGATIPPYLDSMVAKLIVHGTTREAAVARLTAALDDFQIDGVAATLDLHKRIVRHPDYIANRVNIRWLETSLLGTER